MGDKNMLVWNIWGLNARTHQDAVQELVASKRPSIICLQETKLNIISDFDIIQLLGTGFDYVYCLAIHIRGGILVAWRSNVWSVSSSSIHLFSVSTRLKNIEFSEEWWPIVVYGPVRDEDKPAFLIELHELRHVSASPWLLTDDLNMIC
jgi:exonuclease III